MRLLMPRGQVCNVDLLPNRGRRPQRKSPRAGRAHMLATTGVFWCRAFVPRSSALVFRRYASGFMSYVLVVYSGALTSVRTPLDVVFFGVIFWLLGVKGVRRW